jgi:hypothetical protein
LPQDGASYECDVRHLPDIGTVNADWVQSAWEGAMEMDQQERGQKRGKREDVRKQVKVAKDATTDQAKRGHEDFMKQMMDYQYHED